MTFESSIENYVDYLNQANSTIPSETIRNALLLELASIDESSSIAEGATAAKQDSAIAGLTQINQQLDLANGVGAIQSSQTVIATSTVQEIFPLSGTRKRARITNHSPTDFVLIELNGDADINQGIIIKPLDTWVSPDREEARARITVISGTGNDVNISFQETSDSLFSIGEQIILSQNLSLVNIRYPVTIVGATIPLSSLTVELFELGLVTPIATNNYTTNLIPGNTINADFNNIEGFIAGEPKSFYIVVSGV